MGSHHFCGGPLWRVEAWFHHLIGRRFLARVARETALMRVAVIGATGTIGRPLVEALALDA